MDNPRWIRLLQLLLCLASVPLHGAQETSVESCCTRGYEWASQKNDCSSLPLNPDSKECSIAEEQCCLNQLEELHCATGIAIASKQEDCDLHKGNSTCEDKIIKKCCYCCSMGKVAQRQGDSCEQSLLMGYQCGLVFRACCVEEQEKVLIVDGPNKELDKLPQGTSFQDTVSPVEIDPEDIYLHDRCRGGGPCTQQCRNTGSSFLCSCFMGYQLKSDGFTCEDINECIISPNSCGIGQICINTLGSFRCQRGTSCGTGYELTEKNLCKDIDECETGTHNCLPDFICQNTPGSFRCRPKQHCKSGFIQDALGNCIDVNECLSTNSPCPTGQTCINTEGSYACHRNVLNCGRGYHLNEDGTRCVDVDECLSSNQPCGEGHICINSPGSYRCECQVGYYFDTISRTCSDVNECRRYPGRLCAHKCENTAGSYYCSCTIGFKLSADARSCEDLNECESNPCSQECANVYGSYQCYCRRGYQLSDIDGITCEDIDECALPTGGHICAYRCINVPGSFQCTCPASGYKLAPNARNCQDIDECVTETHTCSHNETCFNIQGGFRCLSLECPENYRKSGDTRCERLACHENKECQRLPLRISSYHLSFPTNIQVPIDIFRMGPTSSVAGDKIQLSIISGNEEGIFAIKMVNSHSGVVSMRKLSPEPRDHLLTIQMQLFRHETVSTFIAKLFVFVSAQL
ncbi:fibulin-1 isoform X2 [Varanus komodoensis]|uniref:fibulin-1 isoform X2 n=1 Tax=Varanus komodoensis TaxID=61221 RepID=UPI001CF7DA12|nr:fibulin-1 isoform X2 [Varanus komodoensis]